MAAAAYDLSFKGIRLELKSDCTQNMVLEDLRALFGTDRERGCQVLDCSPKQRPAFPAEDGIGVQAHQLTQTAVFVITHFDPKFGRPEQFFEMSVHGYCAGLDFLPAVMNRLGDTHSDSAI